MTPLQQAAQAVIDRWDAPASTQPILTGEHIYEKLRKALVDELAQSAEPFAWERLLRDGKYTPPITVFTRPDDERNWVPLYLHPPQPQATTPRKPLTDDHVINAMCEDGCERIQCFYFAGPVQKAAVWSFARAIESALLKAQGEKP